MDAPLKVNTFGVVSADDHSPKVFGLFSNRGFTALAGASFCGKAKDIRVRRASIFTMLMSDKSVAQQSLNSETRAELPPSL